MRRSSAWRCRAASLLNGAWAAFLIRSGRAWRSPAILASGKHVLTDVWTSGGVLLGFALVPVTGWLWLAPALAGLVALNIVWTGLGMVRESVDALMDRAVDPEVLDSIRNVISANAAGALAAVEQEDDDEKDKRHRDIHPVE